MVKSVFALTVILLSAVVQAEVSLDRRQWPWSSNQDRDRDQDQDDRPPPRASPPRSSQNPGWDRAPRQTTPAGGWSRPTPQAQQQQQQQPWNRPAGQQPRPQPTRQPSVITITVTKPRGSDAPAPTVYQPQPTAPSLTRSGTWSQPSSWGPPRDPFGPTPVATGPQTIATTTTDPPRLAVPFLTNCGGQKYVEDDVHNALLMGCLYKNKTQTVYESGYPKTFANTQRFNFGVIRGPYWEFPLISSAGYIGGDAGPDRIIFNTACFLAGEITQTGAGYRGWTECKEEF